MLKYLALLIMALFGGLLLTGFFPQFITSGTVVIYYLLKTGLFVATCFILGNILLVLSRMTASLLINAGVSVVFMILILSIVEFTFAFVPRSNHTQLTLASWTWEAFYNGKKNRLGFRERPVDTSRLKADSTLVFIGDSYTEGFGMRRRSNRFTDLVRQRLRDRYEVINFGRNGATTSEEFEILKSIGFTPDIVVFQYFFNDPQDICIRELEEFPILNIYGSISPALKWLVMRSYLANYLFHKFYPLKGYDVYTEFFAKCASSPSAQSDYFGLLEEISTYCAERGIRLIFLVIPNPLQPELSGTQDELVLDYMEDLGVETLYARTALMGIPLKDRIVNSQDMHLSRTGHEAVSDLILDHLEY